MSKVKPPRRKKGTPNQGGRSDRVADTPRGGRPLTAVVVMLVLVGACGLVFYLYQSNPIASQDPDAVVVPSQPDARPVGRYAGPAAFAFTLENTALSPDGRVTAWSLEWNDVVL